MSDYKDRMKIEIEQLSERVVRLKIFALGHPEETALGEEFGDDFDTMRSRLRKFTALPHADQVLLIKQLCFMESYLGVLVERYERAGGTDNENRGSRQDSGKICRALCE